MKILKDIINKIKPIDQRIDITKYPGKIVIRTLNQIKHSYWTQSGNFTVLDSNATNYEIGKAIIKHLALSKVVKSTEPELRKKQAEEYKKATGLKTVKAQIKDSFYVLVCRKDNRLEFTPSITGGKSGKAKGYDFLTGEDVKIDYSENYDSIVEAFEQTLKKCK